MGHVDSFHFFGSRQSSRGEEKGVPLRAPDQRLERTCWGSLRHTQELSPNQPVGTTVSSMCWELPRNQRPHALLSLLLPTLGWDVPWFSSSHLQG